MSQSLPPVKIPSNKWIDLYAATGISVGTQITFQNIGPSEARVTENATEPADLNGGHNTIVPIHSTTSAPNFLKSAATPVGVWAYSREGSILQVEAS